MSLPRTSGPRRVVLVVAFLATATATGVFGGLEDEVGRSETRVRSAPFPLVAGMTVSDSGLLERLDRLGYERVHDRPTRPREYFYGHDVLWIFRPSHRVGGRDYAASLMGLELRREDGRIVGALGSKGQRHELERRDLLWLEPEVLSESLIGDRAERIAVALDELPEQVWRAVLAAEDARFFDHSGIDPRSIARAALENLRTGKVVQGGSTITQQLVKNRDLTPKRTLGRKASEAVRALTLEAEHSKPEILQAYLNQVYLGHVEGLAIHGVATAARAYFSKRAADLSLAEAALLAGIIQAPNRLSPQRHPDRARGRRDRILTRLAELGWAAGSEVAAAKRADLRLRPSAPTPPAAVHLLSWVGEIVRRHAAGRLEEGRGVVVETTLDPHLQAVAERSVDRGLRRLRRRHPGLKARRLTAALVALDADNGDVLAYVGGDPSDRTDRYDRARLARRQPGSTLKPLVMLEAMDECGERRPLHPASRIADDPLRLELPSGPWSPENPDREHRGVVDARSVIADSLNVPAVRVARWCGFDETASTLRRLGLELPEAPPPSFVLGAVETTPLRLARAYTVLATPGRLLEPRAVTRIERPDGGPVARFRPRREKVARPAAAYLVRDMMRTAVEEGTARRAAIEGVEVAGKTGTTRDGWFAGEAGSVVAVVWVGLDGGSPLRLTGARSAGPIWHAFMKAAVRARPPGAASRPRGVVERWIDTKTGLLVRKRNPRATRELFRRGALPRRDRFWRVDRAAELVR